LQQENQLIQENVVEMQQQMQRMEFRHNQELAIAMRGLNRNTRQIEELNQRPGNLQHSPRPADTDESGSLPPSIRWPTTISMSQLPLDSRTVPGKEKLKHNSKETQPKQRKIAHHNRTKLAPHTLNPGFYEV
jgi:hypothetical protein